MSLSEDDRLKALADALTLMLERLGDKALDSEIFNMNATPFDRVPKTTWREMEQFGFTERCDTIGHPRCRFTGLGWYNSLVVTDRLSDSQFKTRLSKLTAVLKDAVKGRHEDAYLYIGQLASASGISEDFIINAIESRLIDRHFSIQGAEWEHQWQLIRVPLDFGLRPLNAL
jgi:hypothetical protein